MITFEEFQKMIIVNRRFEGVFKDGQYQYEAKFIFEQTEWFYPSEEDLDLKELEIQKNLYDNFCKMLGVRI